MKKLFFIYVFFGLTSITTGYSQNQIGQTLFGDTSLDNYGFATSINANGNIIAVGAPNFDANNNGLVRVFEFDQGSNEWIQLGSDILGEGEFDLAGASISLNDEGTIIAIGASLNDGNGVDAGHARIFQFENNAWVQLGQDIDGETEGDSFGASVSLNASGNSIAIGANRNADNGNNSGHVRIFEFDGSNNVWQQIGNTIVGEIPNEQSGRAVSLNDDATIVAIGASQNNEVGSFAGQVRMYAFNESTTTWEQLGQDLNGEEANDIFGDAISLNGEGDIIAIGAIGNDGGGDFAGNVRVYQYNEGTTTWEQLGADLDGAIDGSAFGNSVSLNNEGNIIAIGAPGDVFASPGSVLIYEFNTNSQTWIQSGDTIEPIEPGRFGRSVSINAAGDTIIAGATSAGELDQGAANVLDISDVLSITDQDIDNLITIFPNPFQETITLNTSISLPEQIVVYTTLGQKVFSSFIDDTQKTLHLNQLTSGVYLLEIQFQSEKRIVRRIIKE